MSEGHHMGHEHKFVSVSHVKAEDIKSKWQANFAQRFPINYDVLPGTDKSDKDFFKKHWSGPEEIDYDEFMTGTIAAFAKDPILPPLLMVLKSLRETRDACTTCVDDPEDMIISLPQYFISIVKKFEDAMGLPTSKIADIDARTREKRELTYEEASKEWGIKE